MNFINKFVFHTLIFISALTIGYILGLSLSNFAYGQPFNEKQYIEFLTNEIPSGKVVALFCNKTTKNCKRYRRMIRKLDEKYIWISFKYFDTNKYKDLAMYVGIQRLWEYLGIQSPVTFLYINRNLVGAFVGNPKDKDALKEFVDQFNGPVQ